MILFCTLVGCEPENQELENQHWTSSNPHRLWQCIKQIKPCWHARLSEERYRENDSAWHQLIDSLFSRPCESGIGFHLPYRRFILKQNVPAISLENLLACQWKCLQREVLSKCDFFHFAEIRKLPIYNQFKHQNVSSRAYYYTAVKCQAVIVQIVFIVNSPIPRVENFL